MEHESLIRLGVFLGLFALFALAEVKAPKRERRLPRGQRWVTNLSITLLNTLMLRALALGLPLLAVGAALDAAEQGWGLLNTLAWPAWSEVLLAVLVLDFAIWLQHLITHKVPLLWRLHRVHHADRDMDVTTAVRFHPVEIALSMLLKIGLVYLLGPSALAVVLFEMLLNGTALFNHANLRLPPAADALLRLLLVTPDMHRVHHSVRREEHDSNFGFALSIWDRLFGTYTAQPGGGHEGMTVGLQWQDSRPARLGWSLLLPFRRR
ncbi:fatty acid hydroxylase [Leisingera sp. ANG-M1]|uniref:sterol desaturase family protein n=1 Tax=Leisingera sp. ANG-M1 TaxID=1577895 RepID=UPI00057D945D|nr:sterol desaturase family protein [Leisingera sp. ANG-M1]KIC11731.1 fatty acid hydroxylase [Leisingera sp. ANG-M1]